MKNAFPQSPADSIRYYSPLEHLEDLRRILTNYFSILGPENKELIKKYSEQIKEYQKNGSVKEEIDALLKSGDIYFRGGLYNDAFRYYFSALRKSDGVRDSMKSAFIKIKIGRVYYFSDLWSSLDYIGIGGKELLKSKDPAMVAYAYYAEGTVEKDGKKAAQLFKKALSIQKQIIKEKPNDYKTNERLSYYLNASGDVKAALKIAEKIGNEWLVVLYLNNIGYDMVLKGKVKASLPIYFRSLNICITKRYKTLLRNTYENIARVYRFLGEYKKADLYDQYMHYVEESLYKERFAIQASDSKIKYESKKKEIENKNLKEKEGILAQNINNEIKQKYFLVIGIMIISMFTFFTFFSRRKVKIANLLLDKQNNEISRQRDSLEVLNKELQTSEENLKTAQETAQIANWEWDFINDKLTFSEFLPRLFEVDPSNLKDNFRETIIKKIHPGDRKQFEDFYYKNNEVKKSEEIEYRLILSEGENWIRSKRVVLRNNDGKVDKIFGTVQNITKEKIEAEIKIEMAAQQSFTKRLIEEQEKERKRIAGELHDSIGQDILLIKNMAQLALQKNNIDNSTYENLNEINNSSSDLLGLVREISFNLRPAHLERLGLTETILSAVNKIKEAYGINITCSVDNIDDILNDEDEINFFRIIQEGMNNIIKHSNAGLASIEIIKNAHNIYLNISDDGQGFDLVNGIEHSGGFGLSNILNRVKILNGVLNIETAKSEGTKLKIKIPVRKNGK